MPFCIIHCATLNLDLRPSGVPASSITTEKDVTILHIVHFVLLRYYKWWEITQGSWLIIKQLISELFADQLISEMFAKAADNEVQ